MQIDPALKQWATPTQEKYVDAVNAAGSTRKAGAALDVHPTSIQRSLHALERKAALHGFSPAHSMTRPVPDGYIVKGVSTYYNNEGKPSGQWVKSSIDLAAQQNIMREAFEGMAEELPRLQPITHSVKHHNDNLLNCYVITDYHMGMLAWHEEAGEDWDLKLAEELIIKWFRQAIAQSPDAKIGLFAQLSDFLHFDGMEALTPESKHLLDADTRFAKLVRSAIRVLRQVIDMLLHKHENVHVIMADANHDPVSQIWLREWFSVLYENEPRLTVDRSPSPYLAYEFGNTALFFHHGHKRNPTNVSEVFAAQFREIYGRTKYAYAHMGHKHHLDVKENPMMIVEQHRTLAPNDAYAARGGWLSGRDAKVITYSREYGEVSRLTINSDMLKQ